MATSGWAGRVLAALVFASSVTALLVACHRTQPPATPAPAAPPQAQSSASPPVPAATGLERWPARNASQLPPIEIPAWPTSIPGYTELDPATGLHMTGEPIHIDIASYRLKVSGLVRHPLSLGYDQIRMLPGIRSRATTICKGYFEDNAVWGGASLAEILRMAEPLPGAKNLELMGGDGYSAEVSLADAGAGDNYLAYELAGKPVPVLHGFPIRAVFPSLYGAKWVKWLLEIKVR
ncbi:MAG TPA: molybdopterin-dependent oxidoreductase [Rectinemataceae bacterium]|nr:molybdopterin-dependent oxidoreductase [Rectinemataceae bacterium]